ASASCSAAPRSTATTAGRLRQRFSFVNGQRRSTVAVASTTLLYDFGAPVDVRLPASKDIYAGQIAEK
ncbi:hypothetical protein AB0I50_40800, partial [Streptomyces prunicolor]